jgi:hypothetical protein
MAPSFMFWSLFIGGLFLAVSMTYHELRTTIASRASVVEKQVLLWEYICELEALKVSCVKETGDALGARYTDICERATRAIAGAFGVREVAIWTATYNVAVRRASRCI